MFPQWASRPAIILALLVAWQGICSLDLVSDVILASPLAIAGAFVSDGQEFLLAFRVTLAEVLAALALAWISGISVGAIVGASPLLSRVLAPIFSSLFAIPLIIWYPFFMVWLGIGSESKIVYAAVSGFFPIALNTLNGVQLMDRRYLILARSLGASPIEVFFRWILPFSLPSIVSGLRTGTALTVIGVIVTEMLASTSGIGYWISYHRTIFNTAHVYLGILLALTCTLLVNWTLSRAEKRFERWRDLSRSETA